MVDKTREGPYTDTQLAAINKWWFDGGPPPSCIVTTERYLLTIQALKDKLNENKEISKWLLEQTGTPTSVVDSVKPTTSPS